MGENINDFLQPVPNDGRGGSCVCANGFGGVVCHDHRPGSSSGATTVSLSSSSSAAASSNNNAAGGDGRGGGNNNNHNRVCNVDDDCLNGATCRTSTGEHNENRHDFLQPSSNVDTYCSCRPCYVGLLCGLRDYSDPSYLSGSSVNNNRTAATTALTIGSIVGIVTGGVVLLVLLVFGYVMMKKNASNSNNGFGSSDTTAQSSSSNQCTNNNTDVTGGISLLDMSSSSSTTTSAAGLRQRKHQPAESFSRIAAASPNVTTVDDDGPVGAGPLFGVVVPPEVL